MFIFRIGWNKTYVIEKSTNIGHQMYDKNIIHDESGGIIFWCHKY
jgi:hypothetical protein